MTVDQLIELLKAVLLSPKVIGVTIVIVLYINIVNYIVHYRKRPPQARVVKAKKAAPVASKSTASERALHNAPSDEADEEADTTVQVKTKGKGKKA